jgi:hypothetical protein
MKHVLYIHILVLWQGVLSPVLLAIYHLHDQSEEDEMGNVCDLYGMGDKHI